MVVKDPKSTQILSQVAYLHKAYIRDGFLSSLGSGFLNCLYKSISDSKNSVLLVDLEDNIVRGFIAGTVDMNEVKKELKENCLGILIKVFCKVVISPYRLSRFLETYRYSLTSKNFLNLEAELLSIVVHPNYRGGGVAKNLYISLVQFFKERNIHKFKIIVGRNLKRAQKFYEKMGAIRIGEFELHKGMKSLVYVQEVDMYAD